MPIIFERQINPAKKLAVWHITEPLHFFLEKLGHEGRKNLTEKRQMENVVCSVLLDEMGEPGLHRQLTKDDFGKPYLNNKHYGVSFSHSRDMVACLLDTSGHAVGVDIELSRENIIRISRKFLNKDDRTPFTDLRHCHLVWGAKEVLYKIYARKELDFLGHMTVKFDKIFEGFIHKNDVRTRHLLDFAEINNFILVWNI